MSRKHIYLDYGATTPVDARVLDAMLPYFSVEFGNPSSVHFAGQQAEAAIDGAREKMAAALGCLPGEVLFTSGGSESDNLALRGVALARREQVGANRILTSSIEHAAISNTAASLSANDGFEVEYLPVDEFGMLQPQVLEAAIGPDVALVSIMYANNEVGTINPIADLTSICRLNTIPFHTDAVQGASQLEIDVDSLGVDLMSIGAHKFYGPKGIGALYVREDIKLQSLQRGGSQEFGYRAGTENVAGIVGMAEALHLTVLEREDRVSKYRKLRDQIIEGVLSNTEAVILTGRLDPRLPNHASFTFQHLDGNQLVSALDLSGYACSSGSACKTGLPQPSRILQSIGLDPSWTMGSLRITVGLATTSDQVDDFLRDLTEVVTRLRNAAVAS